LVSARLLNNVNRNIDTVLVGRMLGPATLGVYNIGYQFVLLPQVYFSRAVNNVLFPVLSRIRDDAPRLLAAYHSALLLVASVVFPFMSLVALLAPVLVPLVLGPQWGAVVPLVPWMCLAGAMQSVQGIAMIAFYATGRSDQALRWAAVTTAVNSVAIACGVLSGVHGVVRYYGLVNVGLAAGTHFGFCVATRARVSTPLRALRPALMTNAVVFLPWLLFARSGGGPASSSHPATAIGLSLLSLAAYGAVSWKCNPEAWRFLRRLRELRRESGVPR
jgi:PST family polysaccharide transporter